jgi:hypothetical protein
MIYERFTFERLGKVIRSCWKVQIPTTFERYDRCSLLKGKENEIATDKNIII